MSYKTRENYGVTCCIADCANRGKKCDDCLNKSELKKTQTNVDNS